MLTRSDNIIEVPPLSGGRPRARALVAGLGIPLAGATVVVDCRDLLVPTESFADELVILILRDGGAALMDVINTSAVNAAWIQASAAEFGVTDRLHVDPPKG